VVTTHRRVPLQPRVSTPVRVDASRPYVRDHLITNWLDGLDGLDDLKSGARACPHGPPRRRRRDLGTAPHRTRRWTREARARAPRRRERGEGEEHKRENDARVYARVVAQGGATNGRGYRSRPTAATDGDTKRDWTTQTNGNDECDEGRRARRCKSP